MRYLILALALSACTQPQIAYKPVQVDVPIAIPCPAKMPDEPVSPIAKLDTNASMVSIARAFTAENELRTGYETQLRSALLSCINPV
jgi:hypothetical protein